MNTLLTKEFRQGVAKVMEIFRVVGSERVCRNGSTWLGYNSIGLPCSSGSSRRDS